MNKIKTLEKYTEAMIAIVDFQKKHGKVFGELDELKITVQEAEEALKTDVKENHKMNVANDFFRVTYSPAFSKGYNIDIILKMVKPAEKKKLFDMGAIVIEEKTNRDKIEEAVEQGIIPVEIKQAAFEEKELSPRVMIKEVKQNEKEQE